MLSCLLDGDAVSQLGVQCKQVGVSLRRGTAESKGANDGLLIYGGHIAVDNVFFDAKAQQVVPQN